MVGPLIPAKRPPTTSAVERPEPVEIDTVRHQPDPRRIDCSRERVAQSLRDDDDAVGSPCREPRGRDAYAWTERLQAAAGVTEEVAAMEREQDRPVAHGAGDRLRHQTAIGDVHEFCRRGGGAAAYGGAEPAVHASAAFEPVDVNDVDLDAEPPNAL